MAQHRHQWPLDLLLAEDTQTDVELYRIALARAGELRSIHVVEDGVEAIQYLQGRPPFDPHRDPQPNVVFLDLKMPRMDGFDVLNWLQKHPECSVIPTIIFSNSWLDRDVIRAYKLGANAFFAKPAQLNDLVHLLRATFEFWARVQRPDPMVVCRE
jgi:CheY-like chemotaxis protein